MPDRNLLLVAMRAGADKAPAVTVAHVHQLQQHQVVCVF